MVMNSTKTQREREKRGESKEERLRERERDRERQAHTQRRSPKRFISCLDTGPAAHLLYVWYTSTEYDNPVFGLFGTMP